mmetsp:Transcript_476/g.771  ORF Transcript_476/g.771 Transcript_476/m.771 type:complete len:463 (+) Transcript_476:730-2118(+)
MSKLPKVVFSNDVTKSAGDSEYGVVENGAVADTKLIATHEVGHVLGVDSELFLFFRNAETGEPLTPRPFEARTVDCVDGTRQYIVFPSEDTLQSEISSQGRLYYNLMTPRIQTVVRNHFNCQSLVGARLENQPTAESCTGSHFDERLFYSELMGPIFSGTTDVLSPLTLALLDDSGWYKVHYEGSQVSPFGHAAGCPFVSDNCIINDEVPNYATGAFCSRPTRVNFFSGQIDAATNDLLCDPTHRSIGVCDLFDRTKATGFEFDPNGARYFSDSNLQALTAQTDWCPVPSIPTGVDCTDDTGPRSSQTYIGEEYGPNSRCLNFEPDASSRSVAGCFDVQCDAASRQVIVNGDSCEFDGQLLQFQRLSGLTSNMICPKFAVVCPQLYCQGGCSGRGVCNYATNKCECFNSGDQSPICSGFDSIETPFTLPSSIATTPFERGLSIASARTVSLAAVALGMFIML